MRNSTTVIRGSRQASPALTIVNVNLVRATAFKQVHIIQNCTDRFGCTRLKRQKQELDRLFTSNSFKRTFVRPYLGLSSLHVGAPCGALHELPRARWLTQVDAGRAPGVAGLAGCRWSADFLSRPLAARILEARLRGLSRGSAPQLRTLRMIGGPFM